MATDIASLQIKVDTSQVKTADKDLSNFSSTSKKTESATESLSATYLKSAAALGVISYTLKQTINAATAYQNSLNGLASVARYAGEDVEKTLNLALQTTQDGLLSTTEAATALKNLLARGFSTQEAVTMIERFKDAAAFGRQASLDFGQAVVSATEGIKNENSVLVDNAGVTKNVSVMWKEYAAQINKSVNDLTMAEKRQAEYNGILAETEGQLGNASIAANGVDGANAKLLKSFTDLSITVGQSLTPAYVALAEALTSGLGFVGDNVIKPLIFDFENLGITMGAAAEKTKAFFSVLTDPSSWGTGKLTEEFKRLTDLAEEMRIESAGRLSGITAPSAVMGADSGKRRQDVVVQEKANLKDLERARKKAADEANALEVKRLNVAIWVNQQIYDAEQKRLEESQEIAKRHLDINQRRADENFAEAQRIHKEMTDSQQNDFEDLKNAIDGYSRDMARSLAEFAVSGKLSFGDMIQDMSMRLLQFVNQKYIFDPLFKSLSGAVESSGGFGGLLGNIGNALGSLFNGGVSSSAGAYSIDQNPYLNYGGARAMGGNVSTGKSYIVGENGMELFTPNTSGSITSNSKLGGNQVVNIQIVEAEGTRANVQQQQNPDGSMSIKLIVEQLYGVMNRDLQRGGGIAPTLERRYGLNRMAGT